MRDVVFIGDTLTAVGFRLAGVPSFAPAPEDLAGRVDAERATCRVLMITAGAFAALPPKLAETLEAAQSPLLAILPDVQGRDAVPDIERAVRKALGIEV